MGATRGNIKDYLLRPTFNFTIITQGKQIVCVGIYIKNKRYIHYLSLTVRKNCQGSNLIREGLKQVIKKERPKCISWVSPNYNLVIKEVKK